jgi:hypothetical protein
MKVMAKSKYFTIEPSKLEGFRSWWGSYKPRWHVYLKDITGPKWMASFVYKIDAEQFVRSQDRIWKGKLPR